ncbi:hypothetical protein K438DRAFT_1771321 [Mycena galopus ATCC 62051]|nr:hypothetical protein K438DRAFT_1771321 [Mycena galopus ATCC 62051]
MAKSGGKWSAAEIVNSRLPRDLYIHRNFVAAATTEIDNEAGRLTVQKCESTEELGVKECHNKASIQLVITVKLLFFNVGNGRNRITLLENQEELYKEVARLHQMGWFLATFDKRAQEAHIDINEDISVTQCQLAVEVPKEGIALSKASGYSLFECDGIIYDSEYNI